MTVFNPSKTVTVRASSGSLTAAETTTSIVGLGEYRYCTILLNLTAITVAAGEEVDFFLQTTYDSGTTWSDIECVHFENGAEAIKKLLFVTPNRPTAADVAETSTDATLTDDTKLDLPLGSELRIKTVITNTPAYTYSAVAFLQ